MSAVLRGIAIAQYLEHESRTGLRHEYYRGELFAMVGGTPRHAFIAANFLGETRHSIVRHPAPMLSELPNTLTLRIVLVVSSDTSPQRNGTDMLFLERCTFRTRCRTFTRGSKDR